MIDVYVVMMLIIIVITPACMRLFTLGQREKRLALSDMTEYIHSNKFYLHILAYVVIIKFKKWTDELNEPLKARTGDYTYIVDALEGDFTLWFQRAFETRWLTEFLNFHYLFVYLFMIYVSTLYYIYSRDRDMADKMTLNYILIYVIAVPWYLFFNVEVTSSYIPGMKALLYHDAFYTEFFLSHDPLDNSVPSLHIAIPFAMVLLNWLHVRQHGIRLRDWRHWPFHVFLCVNLAIFCFSILYLGIHWAVDIPAGAAIGGMGALFIHYLHPKLRAKPGETGLGVRRQRTHMVVESALMLLMLVLLVLSIQFQSLSQDERPSMRLGAGDTNADIIDRIDFGQIAEMSVVNLDESYSVYGMLVPLWDSIEGMDEGEIDWELLAQSNEVVEIRPGLEARFNTSTPEVFQMLIIHNPDSNGGTVDVRITPDYGVEPLANALLMSCGSFAITAYVLLRVFRLRRAGRSWDDATPSSQWEFAISEAE